MRFNCFFSESSSLLWATYKTAPASLGAKDSSRQSWHGFALCAPIPGPEVPGTCLLSRETRSIRLPDGLVDFISVLVLGDSLTTATFNLCR